MFQNGDTYSAESVIWSTGFVQNYNWIEIEQAVNEKGFPNHIKGNQSSKRIVLYRFTLAISKGFRTYLWCRKGCRVCTF